MGSRPALLAFAAAPPALGGRGLGPLVHAAGLQLGSASDALERRDLGLQPGDHLPQGVILGQQPLGQRLQLTAWQARKADLLRSRHGGDKSGPGRSGTTASAYLGPAFYPSYLSGPKQPPAGSSLRGYFSDSFPLRATTP